MSEPRTGPGPAGGREWSRRDVPRFVIGSEDEEQDMGQMEAGMKNNAFQEDMEDEEDESVSNSWDLTNPHVVQVWTRGPNPDHRFTHQY